MKGMATKVLDSGYSDFVEALQKLGELQSLAGMITSLSQRKDEPWQGKDEGLDLEEQDTYRMMHAFWQMGWIEVREITRKRKSGPRKNYALKVCLDEIVGYFEQERLRRSPLAKEAFQMHKVQVPA